MPDRFEKNPTIFANLNELFPVLNEKVGLTAEQFKKLVENTFYLYNHLGLADVEVGTISTVYAAPGTLFDVEVTHREEVDATTGKLIDYFDYEFTVAVAKITTGMTVERVRSDNLVDMELTSSELTGDDANKGYHFQFNAKIPKSGVTKEEISDGSEGEVLYVNPNGLPHKKQIMVLDPIVRNATELASAQEAGGTSFADILANWGRFSHFQGNFDNAIANDMNGWSIDNNSGSITNSVNSESHIGFYSPDKVLSLSKRVKFIVTNASYKSHLDTLTLVAAYCNDDEEINTANLDAGNSHAHTLSFVRSPGPKTGFAKYGWALICDLDYGFDSLETAACKAFTLCDGTSFVTKKYGAGLSDWSEGVFVKVVRQNNVFTGYTSEFDDDEILEDTKIELDLDNMTIKTKDGTVNLSTTLTAQQLLILNNFKQANHWGYGSASQPYCQYSQQGSVSNEKIFDIENNKTYEFNPNSATWTDTGVNPVISMGAGRFANSLNKDALYFNNGTSIYQVITGGEALSNKATSITDGNKTSETLFPAIKAVVDYIAANTIKTVKVNGAALTPTNNEVNVVIPIQTQESFTIATSSWTTQSGVTPFTHKATVTASATISADTLVELINDNAVTFATYGFAIASVSGQTITLYSIGQPNASVTIKIGIGG